MYITGWTGARDIDTGFLSRIGGLVVSLSPLVRALMGDAAAGTCGSGTRPGGSGSSRCAPGPQGSFRTPPWVLLGVTDESFAERRRCPAHHLRARHRPD